MCGCREIGERLAVFTRTKLGAWVEMMSYMGRLDMVAGALDVARAYLKVRVPSAVLYDGMRSRDESFSFVVGRTVTAVPGVDSLLEGTRQLVVDHYAEIEECPYDVHQPESMPGEFSFALAVTFSYILGSAV